MSQKWGWVLWGLGIVFLSVLLALTFDIIPYDPCATGCVGP